MALFVSPALGLPTLCPVGGAQISGALPRLVPKAGSKTKHYLRQAAHLNISKKPEKMGFQHTVRDYIHKRRGQT